MKLFYTALLAVTLSASYGAAAQTTTEKPAAQAYVTEKLTSGPEYDKYYNRLKELHIKELSSESHKKMRKLSREFTKKMNYKGKNFSGDVGKDMLGWIKNNFSQTSFESYEAAEKEWAAVNEASMASVIENNDYYTYMRECFNKCDSRMLTDVMMEVMEEYPELAYD